MKYSLLTAVASTAFIVSGALAQAQENPRHEGQPGGARSEAQPGGAAKTEPRETPRAAQMNQEQSGRPGVKEEPRAAQAQERQNQPSQAQSPAAKQMAEPNGAKEKEPSQRAQGESKQPNQRAEEQPAQRQPTRTGAAEEKQNQQNRTGAAEERNPARTGAAEGGKSPARTGATEERNNMERKSTAENRGQPKVIGNVKTSPERATRVTDLLMRNGRRENVNVEINVGARIPDSVTIYPLPPEVLSIAPEYRGYDYFVENDQVVFVSPDSHEIVGSIEYEGRAAANEGTRVAGARPCPIEN